MKMISLLMNPRRRKRTRARRARVVTARRKAPRRRRHRRNPASGKLGGKRRPAFRVKSHTRNPHRRMKHRRRHRPNPGFRIPGVAGLSNLVSKETAMQVAGGVGGIVAGQVLLGQIGAFLPGLLVNKKDASGNVINGADGKPQKVLGNPWVAVAYSTALPIALGMGVKRFNRALGEGAILGGLITGGLAVFKMLQSGALTNAAGTTSGTASFARIAAARRLQPVGAPPARLQPVGQSEDFALALAAYAGGEGVYN